MISRNDFYPEVNMSKAAVNELANKPRYDIDKRRYGNTLTDDMLAIKNPNYQGHTPESYSYFNEPVEQSVQPMTPAGGWGEIMGNIPKLEQNPVKEYMAANPYLKYGTNDHEARLFGRKKNVGEGGLDWGTWRDDWTLEDDILEFPDSYTDEQYKWALQQRAEREAKNRVNSLGIDDLRAEKLGTYTDPEDWVSRRDAEVDSTVGALVNYGALSPATIEQMAKMGVNKPVYQDPYMVTDDDAADTLNSLLNAYRRMNE